MEGNLYLNPTEQTKLLGDVAGGGERGQCHDVERLLSIVSAFHRQKIVVVGDFILDDFVFCESNRISREAPVMILRQCRAETLPGGAGNAVKVLRDLESEVRLVGAVGNDAAGHALMEFFKTYKADASGILMIPKWSTMTRTHILAASDSCPVQQILRVDREPAGPLPEDARAALIPMTLNRVTSDTSVLVSDYDVGGIVPACVRNLPARYIIADVEKSLCKYREVEVTAARIREPKARDVWRLQMDSAKQPELLSQDVPLPLGLGVLLATSRQDSQSPPAGYDLGISTFFPSIYSHNSICIAAAEEAIVAVFALALSAGATYLEATELANVSARTIATNPIGAVLTRKDFESSLRFGIN